MTEPEPITVRVWALDHDAGSVGGCRVNDPDSLTLEQLCRAAFLSGFVEGIRRATGREPTAAEIARVEDEHAELERRLDERA
jgi:hypothetical protein